MFLFVIKICGQNSSEEQNTPDAILLNATPKHSLDELKLKEELNAVISKVEQQKAVDKIKNDTKLHQKDAWGDALKEQESKLKTDEYSTILQEDLYEDQPDGTRRAKYPFVPAGAKTIEDVEIYFKEHPSEMTSTEFNKKTQSDSSQTYTSNLSEGTSGIYGIIAVSIAVCFIIAEVFGRGRHIGRWWSFFLLLCGFIPGIIAISNSPSAKNNPSSGGKAHYIWAYVFLVFGVLNAIILVGSEGERGYMSFVFFVLSFYLFELKKGLIINKNPKYYI